MVAQSSSLPQASPVLKCQCRLPQKQLKEMKTPCLGSMSVSCDFTQLQARRLCASDFSYKPTDLLGIHLHHRIIKVGKDLQDHLIQPSPYHQYHPLNHVPMHHVQPFPGMVTLPLPRQPVPMPDYSDISEKKCLLIFNLNLPWCNLRPFPLVLSLVTCEKRLTPSSPHLSFR